LCGRGRNHPGGDAAQEAHRGEEKELKPQAEVKVMKATSEEGGEVLEDDNSGRNSIKA